MSIVASKDLFFVINSGKIVAWNYKTHEQFEISQEYLTSLLQENPNEQDATTKDLLAAGLLQNAADAPSELWGWDILSRIFHIGTSAQCPDAYVAAPAEQGREYLEYCGSISDGISADAFNYRRGVEVQIVAPKATENPSTHYLHGLLQRRKTNRAFSDEPISATILAAILSETFRYRDHDADLFAARGLETPTRRRSSPSAGSLQSCEAYVLSRNVEGLDQGVYHYWSDKDSLGRLSSLPQTMSFGDLAAGQMLADELAALVIVTCRFDKLAWKYPHSRAYRVALLDAGHLSQTFQLLSTAHGLRTWITGMFFDWDIRSMLGLSSDSQEYPLLMLGLGKGEYCPFDRHVDGS